MESPNEPVFVGEEAGPTRQTDLIVNDSPFIADSKRLEAPMQGEPPIQQVFDGAVAQVSARNESMTSGPSTPMRTLAARNPGAIVAMSSPKRPELVAQATYRKRPQPHYPAAALRTRAEGVVIIGLTVTAAGKPIALEVKESSGCRVLDGAALAAVRDSDFQPARDRAGPVESQIEVPIRFQFKKNNAVTKR